MERIIEAYGLGKASPTKGAPPILDNCSISIGPGMTAVVGPSGAGKTSISSHPASFEENYSTLLENAKNDLAQKAIDEFIDEKIKTTAVDRKSVV